MSPTALLVTPTRPAPHGGADPGKTCRFASNCSCIFNRLDAAAVAPPAPATAAPTRAAVDAEVRAMIGRGWLITAADDRALTLSRQRNIPFCVNVALLLVTGLLWSIPMAVRARHPKVETRVVALPLD